MERLTSRDLESPLERAIHLLRYRQAQSLCQGKRVLDVGCGVGFGSLHLAQVAQHVVAIDVEPAWRVAFASESEHPSNLEFVVCPVERAWDIYSSRDYDVVVAVEVLEHLSDPEHFLRGLAAFREAGGTIFITVPNDAMSYRSRVDNNPHHRTHFDLESFLDLTTSYLGAPSDLGGGFATFGFSTLPASVPSRELEVSNSWLIPPVDAWASADEAHFWYAAWGGTIEATQVAFPAGDVAAALTYDMASLELPARVATDYRCLALERSLHSLRIENEELRNRLWAAGALFASDEEGSKAILRIGESQNSLATFIKNPPSWLVRSYLALPMAVRVPIAKVRRALVLRSRA